LSVRIPARVPPTEQTARSGRRAAVGPLALPIIGAGILVLVLSIVEELRSKCTKESPSPDAGSPSFICGRCGSFRVGRRGCSGIIVIEAAWKVSTARTGVSGTTWVRASPHPILRAAHARLEKRIENNRKKAEPKEGENQGSGVEGWNNIRHLLLD
jgi:hypothetical protein